MNWAFREKLTSRETFEFSINLYIIYLQGLKMFLHKL